MNCNRCSGPMGGITVVTDEYAPLDILQCAMCGHVTDPVFEENRKNQPVPNRKAHPCGRCGRRGRA